MADENNNNLHRITAVQVVEQRQHADQFLINNNFSVEQRNGQRISNLAGCKLASRRNEVFVGKLPRDLFEDELLPFMQQAGTVQQIRLMMDFSGTNRGFGFVTYAELSEALRALRKLNKRTLRPDQPPVVILRSFDNKKLHFGNLPPRCTRSQLLSDLRRILDDVVDAELPEVEPGADKRHALVTFKTHDAATQARRVLIPGSAKIFDRQIEIDWAKPDTPETPPTPPSPPLTPPTLLPPPAPPLNAYGMDILGEKAREMLYAPPVRDLEKFVTVTNIDISKVSLEQLRQIFKLAGRLDLVSIQITGPKTINLEYSTPEHAHIMLEALVILTGCFNGLALTDHELKASKGRQLIPTPEPSIMQLIEDQLEGLKINLY